MQTKIMINGLPGNVATVIARNFLDDPRLEVISVSLTGPDISQDSVEVGGTAFSLIKPDGHRDCLARLIKEQGKFLIVDYSHPSAVNPNAKLYCELSIPFVMGTTGGDRESLAKTVLDSQICAVIAPNMAKQIVGFQAMMEYGAQNFPGLFKGYSLKIEESHQNGKADTSGTAKAMVGYFNQMGMEFNTDQIKKIRDPKIQKEQLGVPKEYIDGHGWHTYTLVSPDKTTRFSFTHNINGRQIYCGGTADAVIYLHQKINNGAKGKVFSMIDVLTGSR